MASDMNEMKNACNKALILLVLVRLWKEVRLQDSFWTWFGKTSRTYVNIFIFTTFQFSLFWVNTIQTTCVGLLEGILVERYHKSGLLIEDESKTSKISSASAVNIGCPTPVSSRKTRSARILVENGIRMWTQSLAKMSNFWDIGLSRTWSCNVCSSHRLRTTSCLLSLYIAFFFLDVHIKMIFQQHFRLPRPVAWFPNTHTETPRARIVS